MGVGEGMHKKGKGKDFKKQETLLFTIGCIYIPFNFK